MVKLLLFSLIFRRPVELSGLQNLPPAHSGAILPLILSQSPFNLRHSVLGHFAHQLYHLYQKT